MTKRPLCLLVLLWITGILLVRALGADWIWRSPGGSEPFQRALQTPLVQMTGTVCRQEEQTYLNLYLEHTSLLLDQQTYSIRKVKCIIKGAESEKSWLGKTLVVSGFLSMPEEPGNPGEFNWRIYEQAQKVDFYLLDAAILKEETGQRGWKPWIRQIRENEKQMLKQIFPEEKAAVLQAMLLGEKGETDRETKEEYQAAGISHVLAISGLHISLLGMGIWKLLTGLGISMGISSAASMGLLVGFGTLIGRPATAFRAILMFGIYLGARLLGRSYDLFSALALAALLLLIENPDLLADGGFQLSFLAVFGMGSYVKYQEELLKPLAAGKSNRVKKWLKALNGGTGIWIFTLPVVLRLFSQVSAAGIFCNLLVLPLLPVILCSGAGALLLGCCSLRWGSVAGIPAYGGLQIYEWIGIAARRLPVSVWTPGQPSWSVIVLYYGSLGIWTAGMLWCRSSGRMETVRRTAAGYGLMLLVLAGLLGQPWKHSCGVTILDVGQGDGIVLQCAGKHFLVDGGSSSRKQIGKQVILPYLKQQGIAELDGVFLTHGDEDHKNGLEEVLEEGKAGWLKISCLYLPLWMKGTKDGVHLEALAELAAARVVYLQAGDQLTAGEMHLTVLHPDPVDYTDNPNGGSMVLEYDCGGICGLLMGDLPEEQEEKILDQIRDCDFLKAGHHGSNGSSGEPFLQKADPELILISCGKKNRYNHPGKEMLKRAEAAGAKIWRTDLQGAILLEKHGKTWRIRSWR